MTFGPNLKIERARRGLSDEESADLIGIQAAFYGQLDRGRRGFDIGELPGITRALGGFGDASCRQAVGAATAATVAPVQRGQP
jgi:transcriptional regulator with XRE-family HTH domain